ncbi:SMU1112c/YaeR family gloxylase I-like metalloprotein [Phyllobacterium meliloti]|uniref:SMU1112c/YaeR family gloxylase I-like metalloprotein n=1 Tax=Phyllobacterium meliloti TaxID=555317 RepID=UPI001D144804|nr:VOC family protein [Phyllobacterium sp. T1293]UGX88615.1 VOC family protein [Phyllobacterium sp. T1293]
MFSRFHHVAVICSDYDRSKAFYIEKLGYEIIGENWRSDSQSWKCDLRSGDTQIELFHFPHSPARPSRPEACGLRHLAFAVESVADTLSLLQERGVETEPVRIDPYTKRAFTFFADPDGLPIEIYEVS